MKYFVFFFLFTSGANLFCQNLKVKRENIFLDKTQIATVKKFRDENANYIREISDLEGSSTSIYKDYNGTPEDYEDDVYIVTADFCEGQMNIHPSFIKGFSTEKGFVAYLMEKGLWKEPGGIDQELFKAEMTSNQILVKKAKNNTEKVKAIDPFVKRNGEIIAGGPTGEKVIGYVESPDHYLKTPIFPIKIYDLNKNLIAKGTSRILTDEEFQTFDGQKHKYVIKRELNEILMPLFLSEVVYELMLGGYIYDGDKPFDASKNVFEKD